MSDATFDVVVIGGGPGGYVAAIRAAELGLKTACVEMRGTLGGTCLNVGCIPSKALLHSSERFAEARDHFKDQGIVVGDLKLDLKTMMARKDKVVGDLTKGIEFLFKKNKVEYVRGKGTLAGNGTVSVELSDGGSQTLSAKHIILATGSEPTPLQGAEINEKTVVTSTGALALKKVPKQFVVIGAGVIGLELGSVWGRLGSEVTVLEYLDTVLPGMDGEIAKQAQRVFTKQGMTFKLGAKVTGVKASKKGATVTFEPKAGGDAETLEADVVLVAIGRRPYTDGLGLDKAGVKTNERGFIPVDGAFQTNVPGVYAIGDCIPGPMLAHKAEDDGVECVEWVGGEHGDVE